MKVPLSWLKDYVSLDGITVNELAERLTTAGLEVASVNYIGVEGPPSSDHLVWDREVIRVGELVAVEPHPDADRLRLATVEYGAGAPKTVVTGAPNLAAGMKVAYATTGATVINGYSDERELVTLEPKTLRGILSEGMVLSERELGLSDEHEGILELPEEAPVGMPLQEVLGDVVLDIELTPNIVGHAASIVGVAREVAALFECELSYPTLEWSGSGTPTEEAVEIIIEVPELNPRFTVSLIRDVTLGPSPAWMQRRLILCDQRPINNVVDVTNYVMLELGQPLHAFDYDALVARAERSGAERPTIIMRTARAGETLTTLDGKVRTLDPEDVLVTDSDGIISLAGIMGGAETEVSETTTTVLLEAASWNYMAIRRSAARHQLHSGAAYRFSRNVNASMALRGNQRGALLIAQVGEGELAAGIVDAHPQPAERISLELPTERVNRALGIALATEEVAAYLERLEFKVETDGDRVSVEVPDYRTDISIVADLVEEVARVHGLDALPMTLIADALPPLNSDRDLVLEERVRDLLVGAGLSEVVSYRMTAPEREARLQGEEGMADASDAGYVALANPISPERRVMRRSLLASLLETMQSNLRHNSRIALFEIGHVYKPEREQLLPQEERRLVLALTGPVVPATWLEGTPRERDFFDLKGVLETLFERLHLHDARYEATEHPTFQKGRAASIQLGAESLGVIGELDPRVREGMGLPRQRVVAADLNLDRLLSAVPLAEAVRPVPRLPAVLQDLAVVVAEDVAAAEVEAAIWKAGTEELVSVELFDLYRGPSIPEGTKSLAYALRYQSPTQTLTDEEVAVFHSSVAETLRTRFDAKIRGEDI